MTNPDTARFRPDIQGLRGVAILLVVAFHAGLPVTGGFVGVDVFFVLSGYLITGILVRSAEGAGRVDFAGFYARRARRLLPAAALAVTATVWVGTILLSPLEQLAFGKSGVASALYLSNAWFIRQSMDYFAPDVAGNPLLHTWSLSVEEQFYLVWPWLIAAVAWGSRPRARATAAIAIVLVLSLAGSVWLTWHQRPWAFFGTHARAWEFACGALAFLVPLRAGDDTRLRASDLAGWSGLALIVGSAGLLTTETPFPGLAAALPAVGTALLLRAGQAHAAGGPARLLGIPPLRALGAVSYSWYLWHWPATIFAAALLPRIGVPGRVGASLLALLAAWVTYLLVERPVRASGRLAARPGLTLAVAAAITVACATSALLAYRATLHAAERPA